MLLKDIPFCSNTGNAKLCLSCFFLLSFPSGSDIWFSNILLQILSCTFSYSKRYKIKTIWVYCNHPLFKQSFRPSKCHWDAQPHSPGDTFSHQVNPGPGFIYYYLLAPILLPKIFLFFFCAFLSHQFHTFLGYVPSRCRWCLCHFEAFQVIPLSSFLLSISSYPICKDGGPLLLLWSIGCSKSVFQSCSGFWHLLRSHSSFLPKTLLFSPLLDPSYSVWFSNT